MKKTRFSIARKDDEMRDMIRSTDKRILAIWARDCTERVIHYFEDEYPDDRRPRESINALESWIETGIFKMSVIRKASLDSHAAAREVGADDPARSAARAAGQAVATAHVKTHSYGPAVYAQQAIYRHSSPESADEAAQRERNWQFEHLLKLKAELEKHRSDSDKR